MAKEMLWDDPALKRRVRAAAKRKGMTLVEALTAVGASRYYLDKTVEDRGLNTVLNLARLFDVPAAELLGISLDAHVERERERARERERERERERRLVVVARMMATQLVTLVCIAGKDAEVDPTVLMELVLREVAAHTNGAKSQ